MQPCRQPGCPEIVEKGYCNDHAASHRSESRSRSLRRKVENTARWKRLSKSVRRENPLCEDCLAEGKKAPELSTDVDHVIDVEVRPDLAFEKSNLRALCTSHHSKKTLREARARR